MLKLYSVFDSKVGAFEKPQVYRTAGEALRAFEAAAKDPNSMLCAHAEDFSLMEIATFDETTGLIEAHKSPLNLGLAASYKAATVKQEPSLREVN